MLRYIIHRFLYTIPLLFGVTLVTFILFDTVGGNPCYQILGKYKSKEAIAQCEKDLGLDKPIVVQYARYVKEVATFDFGRSLTTKQEVKEILYEGIGPSLSLALPAFIIGTLLSIIVSLVVAYFRGRFVDRTVVFICITGMSIPVLAYIIFGQYILAARLDLFPVSDYEYGIASIPYLVLPVLIWVVVGLGYDVRFFRTVILDETNQDYVRTAFAKGLSSRGVFFKHVLKNAMIPIITHVVIQIPFLITGSLLLENFFQIPGLGNTVVMAIHDSDFPVLKAMIFIGALGFSLFHLLTDVCYALVDPRVNLGAN